MPMEIMMPALSPTMKEGKLASWNVREGDYVHAGDTVAEVETDKATMEVESPFDGFIAKILVRAEGAVVPIGRVIAVLVEEQEELENFFYEDTPSKVLPKIASDKSQNEVSLTENESGQIRSAEEAIGGASRHRVFSSPLARRLAKQNGLTLEGIVGSGPHGRVVKRDILKLMQGEDVSGQVNTQVLHEHKQAQPAVDLAPLHLFQEGSYRLVPHDSMRQTIARRLSEAKQTIPHFYVSIDCCIDKLLALRKELNEAKNVIDKPEATAEAKISVNDMVIKAVALTLKAVPEANVSWSETAMIWHEHVDVGVAVSIQNGLITPIVRRAEDKSLLQISREMKDFIARAKARKLKPQEYEGGTTSVSNMGMFGIKNFSAIVNPPQATIFAIGAAQKIALVKEDSINVGTVMNVTLSVDHRAVDGACAARCASLFKQIIENPFTLLC